MVPSVKRKDPALLALHPEVGLLAVGASGLIDGRDRPGVCAEQPDGAVEDALQERLQGETTRKILDGTGERVDLVARVELV